MRQSSILTALLLSLLCSPAKAQFEAGQSFVSGSLSSSAYNYKLNEAHKAQKGLGYYINVDWGTFTKSNKATGWNLSHFLSTRNVPDLERAPRSLDNAGLGISRFVEFYKPVSEKFSVYVRPSVGISYRLDNSYGTNRDTITYRPILAYENQTHKITLGVSLAAGITWRITPKWALYGSFAYLNPINISGGLSSSESYVTEPIQGKSVNEKGGFFEYNFEPSLRSGSIGLGFRYFYNRNKANI